MITVHVVPCDPKNPEEEWPPDTVLMLPAAPEVGDEISLPVNGETWNVVVQKRMWEVASKRLRLITWRIHADWPVSAEADRVKRDVVAALRSGPKPKKGVDKPQRRAARTTNPSPGQVNKRRAAR